MAAQLSGEASEGDSKGDSDGDKVRLILVRHSIAQAFGSDGHDESRVLTKDGVDRVSLLAKELKNRSYIPDSILSSPLIRAMQTAQLLADNLEIQQVIETPELAPENNLYQSLEGLLPLDSAESVMIVSHNPILGQLVQILLKQLATNTLIHFAPAGVVVLELSSWQKRSAELVGQIDAEMLKKS